MTWPSICWPHGCISCWGSRRRLCGIRSRLHGVGRRLRGIRGAVRAASVRSSSCRTGFQETLIERHATAVRPKPRPLHSRQSRPLLSPQPRSQGHARSRGLTRREINSPKRTSPLTRATPKPALPHATGSAGPAYLAGTCSHLADLRTLGCAGTPVASLIRERYGRGRFSARKIAALPPRASTGSRPPDGSCGAPA